MQFDPAKHYSRNSYYSKFTVKPMRYFKTKILGFHFVSQLPVTEQLQLIRMSQKTFGGGIFLACYDFSRSFDDSFPACTLFIFFSFF